VAQSRTFDIAIISCILLNTIVLAMKWVYQPTWVYQSTEFLNYVFASVFLIEAVIKIIGYGKRYFLDGWNIFDFIVVVGSIVGIIISLGSEIQIGPQATILRAFRIMRILKLFKKNKSL